MSTAASASRPSFPALVLIAVALFLIPVPAFSQIAERPFAILLDQWSFALDKWNDQLGRADIDQAQIPLIREDLARIRANAQKAANDARVQADSVRTLLAALGPPPEIPGTAESEDVAQERKNLEAQLAALEGFVKRGELTVARADELLKQLAGQQRTRFAAKLLARGPSPVLPSVWGRATTDAVIVTGKLAQTFSEWFKHGPNAEQWHGARTSIAIATLLAIVLSWPMRHWLMRRIVVRLHRLPPTYARRIFTALLDGLVRALPPVLAASVLYLALRSAGLLSGQVGMIANSVVLAVMFFATATGVTRAILTPGLPDWRIFPLTTAGSARIARRLVLIAAVFAADLIISRIYATIGGTPALSAVHSLIFGVVIAALLLSLGKRSLWRHGALEGQADAASPTPPEETSTPSAAESADTAGRPRHGAWRVVGLIALAVVLAIPVSALLGYAVLSQFLAARLILTGALVALVFLLHGLAQEIVQLSLDAHTAVGRRMGRIFALQDRARRAILFWTVIVIDLCLGVLALVTLLPLWGVNWNDVSTWAYRALFGFRIGKTTISVTDLVLAIVVFFAILAGTRLLQRFLEEKILPQTRLDIGFRYSVKSAIGYIGLIIGAGIAISTLGFDFSNLALIAGALSVGIGFGLQNVVNNFVSGLILLVERPVKVGDWVVIGGYEGHVKRINVRATEIETFDRSSVILPNSELISAAVVNWTHKNRMARVKVQVGVAYGSDTELVHDTLLECAQTHPLVAKHPPPSVLFINFGDSSLDFELRAFILDADYFLRVSSELRFAIDKAFRERGIEIPFPQTDLHIKDFPRKEPPAGRHPGAGPDKNA